MTATLDPAAAPPVVQRWLARSRDTVDAALAARLPAPTDDPGQLCEAMRYAVLGAGKRLRPALVLAAADALGGEPGGALAAACAIELLHAYTLVHDDLPAMDDDDLRRGRPTVHVAFGEATAILTGDALLTLAFGTLAELGPRAADAVAVLARRAGATELLAGQARDLALAARGTPPDLAEVEALHAGKTGALFAAACELGAIAAGADASTRGALAGYGMAIGVAFQHADDRDDAELPHLAALAARRMIALCAEAEAAVAGLGAPAATLIEVARWIGAAAR